jgi:hypothetical protein
MLNFKAKVHILKNSSNALVGFAKLIINDVIEIDGFKIFNGRNGIFVAAPSTQSSKPDINGKPQYFDSTRFLEDTPEGVMQGPVQQTAYRAILEEYGKLVGQSVVPQNGQTPQPAGNNPIHSPASW